LYVQYFDVSTTTIKAFMILKGAVNDLAQLKIRLSDTQTLTDALAEAKNITTTLSRARAALLEV
jgi:hypothetical protein